MNTNKLLGENGDDVPEDDKKEEGEESKKE